MQHTTTGGWNEGGVKLGQLGVAAPRGWDQYSLFLSSALPRSRVHDLHGIHYTGQWEHDREPLRFSLLFLSSCFPFFFVGSLRARLPANLCTVRDEKRTNERKDVRGPKSESRKIRNKGAKTRMISRKQSKGRE